MRAIILGAIYGSIISLPALADPSLPDCAAAMRIAVDPVAIATTDPKCVGLPVEQIQKILISVAQPSTNVR